MRSMKLMIFFNKFLFDLFGFVQSFTFLKWLYHGILNEKGTVLWKFRTFINWRLGKLRVWRIKFKMSLLKLKTWVILMLIFKSNVLSLQNVNVLFFTVFLHFYHLIGFIFLVRDRRLKFSEIIVWNLKHFVYLSQNLLKWRSLLRIKIKHWSNKFTKCFRIQILDLCEANLQNIFIVIVKFHFQQSTLKHQ